MKPVLPLTVKGVELNQKTAAIYYTITFVDAEGREWTAENATFTHDLKLVGQAK
jgi:hypothetical protein